MALDYTPPTFSGGIPSSQKLSEAFDDIAAVLERAVSLDGHGPNQMEADFDLNGHELLNVGGLDNGRILTEADFDTLSTSIKTVQTNLTAFQQTTTLSTSVINGVISGLQAAIDDIATSLATDTVSTGTLSGIIDQLNTLSSEIDSVGVQNIPSEIQAPSIGATITSPSVAGNKKYVYFRTGTTSGASGLVTGTFNGQDNVQYAPYTLATPTEAGLQLTLALTEGSFPVLITGPTLVDGADGRTSGSDPWIISLTDIGDTIQLHSVPFGTGFAYEVSDFFKKETSVDFSSLEAPAVNTIPTDLPGFDDRKDNRTHVRYYNSDVVVYKVELGTWTEEGRREISSPSTFYFIDRPAYNDTITVPATQKIKEVFIDSGNLIGPEQGYVTADSPITTPAGNAGELVYLQDAVTFGGVAYSAGTTLQLDESSGGDEPSKWSIVTSGLQFGEYAGVADTVYARYTLEAPTADNIRINVQRVAGSIPVQLEGPNLLNSNYDTALAMPVLGESLGLTSVSYNSGYAYEVSQFAGKQPNPGGSVYLSEYGVLYDGSDETTKVQLALDSGASVVYGDGPRKTVVVSSLKIPSNTTFDMQYGKIEKNLEDANRQFATISNSGDTAGDVNIVLRNIRMGVTGAGGGFAITMYAVTGLTIRDVFVESLGTMGQWATRFNQVKNVLIENYQQHAGNLVYQDGLHFTGGENIIINNCNISSGDDAISFTNGTKVSDTSIKNVVISNCILKSHHAGGIRMQLGPADASPSLVPNLEISEITISNVNIETAINGYDGGHSIILWNTQGIGSGHAIKYISMNNIYIDPENLNRERNAVLLEQVEDISLSNVRNNIASSDIGCGLEHCQRISVSDSLFKGDDYGLRVRGGSDISVNNCRLSGNIGLQFGVSADKTTNGSARSINIEATSIGTHVRNVDGLTLEGIKIDNSPTTGFQANVADAANYDLFNSDFSSATTPYINATFRRAANNI